MGSTIFALDIGTRSVVGIILQEYDDTYHVVDLLAIEHKERSMIDGQIHNVLSVTNVISDIKNRLEEKHGPLHKVSVAAAGRALKTIESKVTIDISQGATLSEDDVHMLELSAVHKAQTELLEQDDLLKKATSYYCVGYSILHYKIDDENIGSLIDQSGSTASVEVIATFLPQVVIDSLLSALKRSGLEMEALTLEPIAAIQVLIPPSMRRLNVALVDIGAGTSDIALTENNTITAYGMVPLAGDEITEALSNEYLLDFPLAEKMKRQLATSEEVTIQDILGFEESIPVQDVNTVLKPTVDKLATKIGEEILKLNGRKSPQAVILIGGGSLTPQLTELLGAKLALPKNRIAVRNLDAITGVTYDNSLPNSPDLITPIGIAIAARQSPIRYMSVTVNERNIRLFELQTMTLSDALLASNIDPKKLYGKPGHGMSITFNDRDIIIPGQHGSAPILQLNGNPASTKDPIRDGDIIEVVRGEHGEDAAATPLDLIDEVHEIRVFFNGQAIHLKPSVTINGQAADLQTSIQDRNNVQVTSDFSLYSILQQLAIPVPDRKIPILLNGKRYAMTAKQPTYLLHHKEIPLTYTLKNNDVITMTTAAKPTVEDLLLEISKLMTEQITVTFNGDEVTLKKERLNVLLNEQQATMSSIIKEHDSVQLTEIDASPFIFSDVFIFTKYELPSTSAGAYQLLRNGQSIAFNDQIFGGDQLEIIFST